MTAIDYRGLGGVVYNQRCLDDAVLPSINLCQLVHTPHGIIDSQ